MRVVLATLMAMSLMFGWLRPVAAADVIEAPARQVPDVRPFRSAHFGMAGTVKFDGITVDVLGEGDLVPPDRQRASFKFGPVTVEVVMIGDSVYTRTRFERNWSREFSPQAMMVGTINSADIGQLQRDVRGVGTEVVSDVATDHYTAALNVHSLLEPVLADAPIEVRRVLETLRGSIDIWVGSQDRMVRQERLIITVTVPSIEPDGEDVDATVDLTLAYSRLNDGIVIEAPTRNDPSPIRTPHPDVVPVVGPAGSPSTPGSRGSGPRAPVQMPGR